MKSKNIKTNAKRQFTKDCMFSALMILMQRKNFTDITITELVKKAGFSRMAFYRNYDTTLDVIVDFLEQNPFGFDKNIRCEKYLLEKQTRKILQYLLENKVLFENLTNANLMYLFKNTLEKYFINEYLPAINNFGFFYKYDVALFINLYYEIIVNWAKKGMDEKKIDEVITQAVGCLYKVKAQHRVCNIPRYIQSSQ